LCFHFVAAEHCVLKVSAVTEYIKRFTKHY
jgi:hypothetical protein